MVPAVAGGILRRPQASASALGLYDSVNCLDLCLGKKSALVEHLVIVYIEYVVTTNTFRYEIFSVTSHRKKKEKLTPDQQQRSEERKKKEARARCHFRSSVTIGGRQ